MPHNGSCQMRLSLTTPSASAAVPDVLTPLPFLCQLLVKLIKNHMLLSYYVTYWDNFTCNELQIAEMMTRFAKGNLLFQRCWRNAFLSCFITSTHHHCWYTELVGSASLVHTPSHYQGYTPPVWLQASRSNWALHKVSLLPGGDSSQFHLWAHWWSSSFSSWSLLGNNRNLMN